MSSAAVSDFWSTFREHADSLSRSGCADSDAYDSLSKSLQKIDGGLFVECSSGTGDAELIISAEGNATLFDLVEAIVREAPPLRGWKYFALKPRLGFPEIARWENYQVPIEDVTFEPLENSNGELGLMLLIPGLQPDDEDDAHNALLRAIDHGLGERAFAEAIQHSEVAALEGAADEYIPLVDLEKYIEWRQQNRDS